MSEPENMLAEAIRKAFAASGMSIQKAARQAGVHYASAHRLLTGTGDATLLTGSKLARIFGLEMQLKRRSTSRRGK